LSIQAYPEQLQAIRHPAGDELAEDKKTHPVGGKSLPMVKLSPLGRELTSNTKRRPAGEESHHGRSCESTRKAYYYGGLRGDIPTNIMKIKRYLV